MWLCNVLHHVRALVNIRSFTERNTEVNNARGIHRRLRQVRSNRGREREWDSLEYVDGVESVNPKLSCEINIKRLCSVSFVSFGIQFVYWTISLLFPTTTDMNNWLINKTHPSELICNQRINMQLCTVVTIRGGGGGGNKEGSNKFVIFPLWWWVSTLELN